MKRLTGPHSLKSKVEEGFNLSERLNAPVKDRFHFCDGYLFNQFWISANKDAQDRLKGDIPNKFLQ